jgi:hypothetical protein
MDHVFVTVSAPVASRSLGQIGTKIAIVAALFSFGCGSDDSDGKTGSGNRGTIVLEDRNNYSSESSLTIPTVETVSGLDVDVCWTDAVKDLQCHELEPQAGLDNMSMLRFLHLTTTEVAAKLTAGQLPQSAVDGYSDYHTDHESTCTKLSSLSLFGTKFELSEEYVESSDRVYLLILSKGTTPGVGARTMTFLKPSEASTNTKVDVPPGCGMLDFSADLGTAKPVTVPAKAPWTVDWQDVTIDGQGNAIAYESIDRLLVGFFEGKTVADLEAQIFDIESIATSLWELPLKGGRKADLALTRERTSGESFTGFERTDGVWLLGLTCSTCQNPQPVVLSVLDPGANSP